jgi:hypothetical protein
MDDPVTPTSTVLRDSRSHLRDLCTLHATSVSAFMSQSRSWFKLELDENDSGAADVRHLSSSASCFGSLGDIPPFQLDDEGAEYRRLTAEFAVNALARDPNEWRSEGGAYTYCRARTLPTVLKHLDSERLDENRDLLRGQIEFMWRTVKPQPRFQAIFEHFPDRDLDAWFKPEIRDEIADETSPYPPNAFSDLLGSGCSTRCTSSRSGRGRRVA